MSADIPTPQPLTSAEADTKKWITEQNGEANVKDFERGYQELRELYELTGDDRTNPRTLSAMLYRTTAYSQNSGEDIDFQTYENNSIAYMVETTRKVRSAVKLLQNQFDCDPLADRNCFNDQAQRANIIQSLRSKAIGVDHQRSFALREPQVVVDANVYTAMEIVEIMGANANTFRSAEKGQDDVILRYADDPKLVTLAAIAIMRKNFYHTAATNVAGMRYDAQRALRRICSGEFDNFLSTYDQVFAHLAEPDHDEVVAEEILASKKLELDYRILPPGTDLRDFAETFSEQASESIRSHIDLNRLKVLDDLRQRIGTEKCFFMTGKPSGKAMPDKSGKTIAEDYIGLVIQHHDQDGNVTAEDCVATSPVARKHAGYIVRHDASAGLAWRDILQMSKRDATKYFNARALRFDPVEGKDTYEAFVEKALTLLSCPPEQFDHSYHLAQKKDGTYTMRHRGADVAKGVFNILNAGNAN